MKNYIRIMITALLMALFFSIQAYAAPETTSQQQVENFADRFNLTVDQLRFVLPSAPVVPSEASMVNKPADIPVVNYNAFGSFSLSKGFDNLKLSTFSSEKTLVGQGLKDSLVGVLVFDLSPQGSRQVIFESYKTIGASGLYSEVVKFKPASVQYVAIAVKQADSVRYRVFEVTTKQMETKLYLENLELNFEINQTPVIKEATPSILDLININNIEF